MAERAHDIAVFAGWLEDEAELLRSASGGLASALAARMTELGGFVAGVRYSEDFYSARYTLVHRVEDLEPLRGSKYIETEKGQIFREAKAVLEGGGRLLFFGLPCINAALRRYLGQDCEGLIAVDLICHGPCFKEVHRQYVHHLERLYESPITAFSVRHKAERWQPSYLRAEFESGEVFTAPFSDTEYGFAFRVLGRRPCYDCRFRGDSRTGDIMLGDFWGAEERDPFWNEKGVSSILVHSEKGLEFLRGTKGIRLFESSFERVAEQNPYILIPRRLHPDRDRFEALFRCHGLIEAVRLISANSSK